MEKDAIGYVDTSKGYGNPGNFDLKSACKNFTFFDFCSEGRRFCRSCDDPECEYYGGFLIVTGKQYVCGKNGGDGKQGSHEGSRARFYCDTHNRKSKNLWDYDTIIEYSEKLSEHAIVGRIMYAVKEHNEITGTRTMEAYLDIKLPKSISQNEFNMFVQFAEDYMEDIKLCLRSFNFEIRVYDGPKEYISTNLGKALEILRDRIDFNKKDDEEETTLKNSKKNSF